MSVQSFHHQFVNSWSREKIGEKSKVGNLVSVAKLLG